MCLQTRLRVALSRRNEAGVFYCQILICYNIVDMKFLKQGQRSKPRRKLAAQEDAENNDPNGGEATPTKQPALMVQNTQIEEGRREGEEEEYREGIVKYLAEHPETLPVEGNYFLQQPDITEHMRAVLLNWLIDVHLKYKLQPETLFVGVQVLDGYLSRQKVSRQELQLVGITALWIAAKYEETYQVPKLANLVFICDSAYSREQILAMEGSIIQTLDFQLLTLTPYHYFQTLHRLVNFAPKDYYFCRYLLEITLFSLLFRNYHPRVIAAAVGFFLNKLRKKETCWPSQLAHAFQVTQQELKPCARDICTIWHRIQEIGDLSSLRNKFLSAEFKEVAKIRMGPAVTPRPSCLQESGSLRA